MEKKYIKTIKLQTKQHFQCETEIQYIDRSFRCSKLRNVYYSYTVQF